MTSPSWIVVQQLLKKEDFGVLATLRKGQAYASLVAFVASPDSCSVYFATARATRKYNNLSIDDEVALLIDNRANHLNALYETVAVTVYGKAKTVRSQDQAEVMELYQSKHPQLKRFITAPTTVLFRIAVDSYHLVERFQHVTEFRMIK